MNAIASRLAVRLVVIQLIVGTAAVLTLVTFAPRLLLLEDPVVVGTIPVALWAGVIAFVVAAFTTTFATRRIRGCLAALAAGSGEVDPADVLSLSALPFRLIIADVTASLGLATATLIPPLRPTTNDLYTQASLLLLTMTIVSAASLPLYVLMRTSVARVLELVPVAVSRDALAMMDLRHRRFAEVRQRLVAAVAAPVAFVALGASLLVYAHARTFDTSESETAARSLAAGALEIVGGSEAGRKEALFAALQHGFRIELSPLPAPSILVHDDEGQTRMTVPLAEGHAAVQFATTPPGSITWIYVLLAVAATALAAILGSRLGQWFVRDVVLATRAVRETGAADVVRGTRVRREARFASIGALMDAIDELGGVFREFASAQERAIDASAATERMRGLFLASMSHDLKGPLNAVLGFAELVSRGRLSEPQRESLAIIEQRGRELLTLIQTILDSARVEAGELAVEPEWTMMGDVVMSAVLEARDLAVGSGVEVIGEIQPGVPKLYIDGARVVQALSAVIVSAVRFTDKGVVHVRATLPPSSDRLRIDVEIAGRTLPMAELEKIFEAFKDSDRRRHGSLGLGLSLARAILEIHAGGIDVSTTGGGRVAFHAWLPTSAERVAVRIAEMTNRLSF